jgi:hypothetical protein
MSTPPELRTLYHEGRLLPFIGAGISMSVSWSEGTTIHRGPSWAELVNQASNDLGFSSPELLRVRGTDLQILEYYKTKYNSHTRLTNWLVRTMNPPDDSLRDSPVHRELAGMTKCSMFYTTNFDDFIERAFVLNGRRCSSIAVEHDLSNPTEGCEIVKFHGDLNHPEQMVLSESDFEKRLKLSTPMDFRFRSDVLGKAILFLGYSFRDSNVAYLFRLVNDGLGLLPNSQFGRRAYIAVADPSDFEIRLFRSRNIHVIPINGVRLTLDVADLLKEIRS